MHDTALQNGKRFFETYLMGREGVTVVDVGSQDVTGSLRDVAPPGCRYVGVDFVSGKGVDVVLENPYKLPFESGSIDVVVCSSCFEHSEMFWLLFLEILRILRPNGLFYLNVPSNGRFHRYPVDCWRFYPDSGLALVRWAKHSGLQPRLLESYTSNQIRVWNDYIAVFLKDDRHTHSFNRRILDTFKDFTNGFRDDTEGLLNFAEIPQDQANLGWTIQKKVVRFIQRMKDFVLRKS